jgi:hypothetical protein
MEQKKLPHYKFMFTANEKGVYAIRVIVKNVEYIVEPYQIFNTIYSSKKYFFLYLNEEEYCGNKTTLCANTEIKDDIILWRISSSDKPNYDFNIFAKSNYVNDIENVLGELLEIIKNGEQVIYNSKRNFYYKYNLQSEISGMCEQIRNTKQILLLHFPRYHNVIIEEFSFSFIEEYSCDTDYKITLGNRKFRSALSDWSNELEHIRYMIEGLIYKRQTEIKIRFEDDPTTIFFNEINIRTDENTFSNEDKYKILEVTIVPNSFVKGPILHGYCRREQAVKALYEGLLKLSMRHSKWFECDLGYGRISWEEYKMVVYNKFKSPIIEDYINKIAVEESSFRCRQREIKRIFRIMPDCISTILLDDEGCAYFCDEDTLELCIDKERNYVTINIPGIYQWQQEFESATDFAKTKTKDDFDWVGWHKRGIELAKQLRAKLPNSCDLWYDSPYEDKSGTIKESFLVM